MNRQRIRPVLIVCIAVLLAAPLDAQTSGSEPRHALLIANGSYRHFGSLSNPVPEARQLRDALRGLGFTVSLVENASREGMLEALGGFEATLKRSGGIAFFHYGGHGVQVGGKNYLIPADADIPDERRVSTRAVDVDEIMAALDASGSSANIVVLDACRNNPLPAASGRSATRGLSVVGVRPKNSIIIYAAERDTEARDGVFTPTFIRALVKPGLSLAEVMTEVRREVYRKTDGAQTPGEYSQLFDQIYLAGRSSPPSPASISPAPAKAPSFGAVQAATGNLSVKLATAGTLSVGGLSAPVPAGTVPVNDLPAGAQTVTVRYADGKTENQIATVEAGRTASLSFAYVPAPKSAPALTTALPPERALKRVALVIGNGAYSPALSNPTNDAADMAALFKKADMEVISRTNLDLVGMEQAIGDFVKLLKGRDSAVVFYAGHGVQVNGENYLIPVKESIDSAVQVRSKGIAVNDLLERIKGAGVGTVVLFLDACRDNPFLGPSRSGTRGLSVQAGPKEVQTLVALAAPPGSVAIDGTGRNSVFSAALLKELAEPGLPISESMKRVSADVLVATGGNQSTWVNSTMSSHWFLVGAVAAALPAERTSGNSLRGEIPVQGGIFQMGSTTGDDDEKPVHAVTVSDFWMMKTEVTQRDYAALMGTNPSEFKGDTLPVETVSWYDAVAYANKLSNRDGLQPAYRISGTSVDWDRSANGWRLPTEAEWEYAARGGRSSRGYTYAGSNDAAAVAWYGNNSGVKTNPVGTKAANELGLHDLSGNVWEWCWDWMGAYSAVAQTDPTGSASGTHRVRRGGGWILGASRTRSADRNGLTPDDRTNFLGLRLVRSLH
jgi:uncharacterized caspase-like protein